MTEDEVTWVIAASGGGGDIRSVVASVSGCSAIVWDVYVKNNSERFDPAAGLLRVSIEASNGTLTKTLDRLLAPKNQHSRANHGELRPISGGRKQTHGDRVESTEDQIACVDRRLLLRNLGKP